MSKLNLYRKNITFAFLIIITFSYSQSNALEELRSLKSNYKTIFGIEQVPLNHGNKDSMKIEVAYLVLKTPNLQPKYPIVYLSGGPGVPTITQDIIETWQNSMYLQYRDIILIDQRGMGLSTPLPNIGNSLFNVMTLDVDIEEEQQYFTSTIIDYQEKNNSDKLYLEHFNTFQTADDIHSIVSELGYSGYHLLGTSYGTRLARIIQDTYPENVISVILDSPTSIEDDFLIARIESYAKTLLKIFNFCSGDTLCNDSYPKLNEIYKEALLGLRTNPLKIELNGESPYYLNTQDANYFIRRSLYSGTSKADTPKLIQAINDRDSVELQKWVRRDAFIFDFLNMSSVFSIEAQSMFNPNVTEEEVNRLYEQYPFLIGKLGFFNSLYFNGNYWHTSRIKAIDKMHRFSKIPTLVFVNEFDPATPPENAENLMRNLSNGKLFTLDADGHGATNSPCAENIINTFLDNPNSKLNFSCLKLSKN